MNLVFLQSSFYMVGGRLGGREAEAIEYGAGMCAWKGGHEILRHSTPVAWNENKDKELAASGGLGGKARKNILEQGE